MIAEFTFEYESVAQATSDECALLEVFVTIEVDYDRLDQSFRFDTQSIGVINVDTNETISFSTLPMDEQKDIERMIQDLGHDEAVKCIEQYGEELEYDYYEN